MSCIVIRKTYDISFEPLLTTLDKLSSGDQTGIASANDHNIIFKETIVDPAWRVHNSFAAQHTLLHTSSTGPVVTIVSSWGRHACDLSMLVN